jgi:hypothetical protein
VTIFGNLWPSFAPIETTLECGRPSLRDVKKMDATAVRAGALGGEREIVSG